MKGCAHERRPRARSVPFRASVADMMSDPDILASPLFGDDQEGAHRQDQWSYPKGIMRDAMVANEMDQHTLADHYFQGAEAIVELVLQNRVEDYVVATPILYLYRHSIELYLKVAIEKKTGKPYLKMKRAGENGHELDQIVQRAPHVSAEARARILELHAIDPKSTFLRFGGGGFEGPEGWAELTALREKMRALRAHLVDLISRIPGPENNTAARADIAFD
jgi:hypothetical protein